MKAAAPSATDEEAGRARAQIVMSSEVAACRVVQSVEQAGRLAGLADDMSSLLLVLRDQARAVNGGHPALEAVGKINRTTNRRR
jgi:antirestriction protein ArdC